MVHTLDKQNEGLGEGMDMKPKKFILWLFVVSSTIMFGGWTSYYIVFSAAKGKGHGLVLPELFTYSTIVLVVSSACLFLASRALKSGALGKQRVWLWITLILGLVFAYMQFSAWRVLVDTGAFLTNNNAAISMIYIVSGFHLLHIVAGIALMVSALAGSYGQISAERRKYRMDIASIFWHFIDILWIYLYVFLLLNS
ncbi:cytochrome c oxidase subunit 3 [Pedobacter faecalis]|uniref:cytochrome c oxidase subunit 3 n=1 Tax=Pedobacter faecalis TaxID=3041495 RepID=UPI00254C406D|nr:cytochrome c oxidase subunit 3 [Pedobacter sp. ELA7]